MRTSSLAALVIAALMLSACNANTNPPNNPPTVAQIAGEYSGTVTDSVLGNGTATVTLSQKASSIGGTVAETFGSGPVAVNVANTVALTIDFNDDLNGSGVASLGPGGSSCGFNFSGTIDPSTGVLNATYKAYSGCSGQNGSFSLTQTCTDPSLPSALHRRSPDAHGFLPC